MPITFFGETSVPVDGGSNAIAYTLIPPSNMVAGDLTLLFWYEKTVGSISTMTSDGGQSWVAGGYTFINRLPNMTTGVMSCIFNGVWSGDVTMTPTTESNVGGTMLVFRPTQPFKEWSVPFNGNGAGAVQTVASPTYSNAAGATQYLNRVTVVIMETGDDNTWGSLTGTGWSKAGLPAQYRNLDFQDSSRTFAYYITSTNEIPPTMTQTQLTLGTDDSFVGYVNFNEILAPINNQWFFSD